MPPGWTTPPSLLDTVIAIIHFSKHLQHCHKEVQSKVCGSCVTYDAILLHGHVNCGNNVIRNGGLQELCYYGAARTEGAMPWENGRGDEVSE